MEVVLTQQQIDERDAATWPLDRKASVIITISDADESPEQAVSSVIENHRFFRDLHIIKFGYSTHAELYPGWSQDLERLNELNMAPIWHSELDASKLQSRAAIHIEPDLRVADGALAMLHKDIDRYTNCEHFAVSSITYIEASPEAKRDPRAWIEAMSYGFLLVIMMMDSLRSLVSLFQYHRTTDLRAQLVTTTFPNRVRLASSRWWMWWIGTGMGTIKRGGPACMQIPAAKDQGIAFVLRTIKTHKHMGVGIWIIGYVLYYLMFGWPWWNAFISTNWRFTAWFARDMSSLFWIITYMLHTVVVGYIALIYMEFPLKMLPLQVLLYTFYLTASPVIFIYGRFHTSRASWISAKSTALVRQKKKV